MFLILAGRGTLRHGEREVDVKVGDFILYPAGDPAPHTFINTGVAPMEYLATGDRVAYEALDKTLRNKDVTTDRAEKEAWFKAGR